MHFSFLQISSILSIFFFHFLENTKREIEGVMRKAPDWQVVTGDIRPVGVWLEFTIHREKSIFEKIVNLRLTGKKLFTCLIKKCLDSAKYLYCKLGIDWNS